MTRPEKLKGKHYRALLGALMILGDFAVFCVEHLVRDKPYEMMELVFHVVIFVLAYNLIDAEAGKELFSRVVSAVPFKKS